MVRHLLLMCLMVTEMTVQTTAGGADSHIRYVSVNGQDGIGTDCSSDTPCASFSNGLSNTEDGGTVHVIAKGSDVKPLFWCRDSPLVITSSVLVSGYNGTATVGCERGSGRMIMFNITGFHANDSNNFIEVVFQDLVFTDTIFDVSRAKVTFKNCIIRDSKWVSSPDDPQVGIHVVDSDWVGSLDDHCMENCEPTAYLTVMAEYLDLYMASSRFYHSKLMITASQSTSFLIEGCVFSNLANQSAILGGIYLTVGNDSNIVVRDSLFERQYHSEPIQSIIHMFHAAMVIHVELDNSTAGSNVTAYVENCNFRDNERGLTFIGPFIWTNVSSCTFSGNIAMHSGAGILYLNDPDTPGHVHNCTFDTNSAGAFRSGPVEANQDSFQVIGDDVHIHSNCCNGIMSFVGKGGAIRIVAVNLTLLDCTFRNNTARKLGGAIFVDQNGTLTLDNTLMENSPVAEHAKQGDLMYSNGHVRILSAQLVILTALNHVAMVSHSGDNWSIEVTDLSIVCPIGYRLRVTNSSAYGKDPRGFTRSYKMDQLSYFCDSCPRNQYSLDRGALRISLDSGEDTIYTLMINGEMPQAPFSETYQYHDIECRQCPYGGECQQWIKSVPNFWGYSQENQVLFQQCPKGYCCGPFDCTGYSICAEYRTGTLCGQCQPGYSEALFSAKCFPDDECESTWLWPVAVLSGFLYALCLLFENDLALFFKGIMVKIPKPGKHKKRGNDAGNEPGISLELTPEEQKSEEEGRTTTHVTGTGFLTTFFYYFQDAQLLKITTVFTSVDNQMKSTLKVVLSTVFMFSVNQLPFMDKLCFLQGLTPSKKMLFKAMFVPYVLLQFGFIYIAYRLCQKTSGTISSVDVLSRISTGFILALLFTYQEMATASFALLNCVPVGGKNVLFIEGTVTCYEWWQYVVLAYVVCCIVPFCLVLLIGPGLLKDGLISLTQFFCGCILPLPLLVYWVVLRLKVRGKQCRQPQNLSAEIEAVIDVLQGPFKESESKYLGPMCGSGILIGCRLILVLFFTFVNNILVRMLCMQFVCFIILVHHMHVLPYKVASGNLAGGASAFVLLIIGCINLVRAAFEAAQYLPHGPNVVIMQFLEEVEHVFLLWFPAFIMLLVVVSVVMKLVFKLFSCLPWSTLTGISCRQARL